MYSRRWPSGSRKYTAAAGIHASTTGSFVGWPSKFNAAMPADWSTCGAEEAAADARVTLRLVDPQEPDLGDAAPGMTAEASVDSAAGIPKQDHEQTSVVDAGGGEVEFVDVLLQDLEVFECRLVGHRDVLVRHG